MKHFTTLTVVKAAVQDNGNGNGNPTSGILNSIFSFVLELVREKGKAVQT